MAHRKMIVTEAGASRYRTRMLQAGAPVDMDGPSSRLWERMGWATPAPAKRVRKPEPTEAPADEMKALRAEYRAKFGKGPGPSWDAVTIREKIARA